jgi:hypothetical protein
MRVVAADLHNATGGVAQRDMAWMLSYHARGTDEAGPGLVSGGPIDAPCYVPAGSVNGNEYHDWQGDPMPGQSLFYRA